MEEPKLAGCAWPAVASGGLLVVPVGSLEQHGPHLPLDTDTRLAIAVVDRFARHRPTAVVAPPVAYGASGEHQTFPGTISIGQEALEMILVELGRSATQTFDRLVFVNGHGGNAETLARAVRILRGEDRQVLGWNLRIDGSDSHAGRSETAMMLAVAPGDVDMALAEPGNSSSLAELIAVIRDTSVRSVSANGILGDPTGATAGEGRELLENMAEALADAVSAWLS